MTKPRVVALWVAPAVAFALLVVLVASREPLWVTWPGTVVRLGGFMLVAAGLYALAARWDGRAARR
ncbi:hypothetical protein [Cellulomonas sp.]|uniref:hypothetical protein n=1 Tax=Cellulomonas sp. TaxID=40001 RepID=UPI003BAB6C5E